MNLSQKTVFDAKVRELAMSRVGPAPPNSFIYGAYEMALRREMDICRAELRGVEFMSDYDPRLRSVGGADGG